MEGRTAWSFGGGASGSRRWSLFARLRRAVRCPQVCVRRTVSDSRWRSLGHELVRSFGGCRLLMELSPVPSSCYGREPEWSHPTTHLRPPNRYTAPIRPSRPLRAPSATRRHEPPTLGGRRLGSTESDARWPHPRHEGPNRISSPRSLPGLMAELMRYSSAPRRPTCVSRPRSACVSRPRSACVSRPRSAARDLWLAHTVPHSSWWSAQGDMPHHPDGELVCGTVRDSGVRCVHSRRAARRL